MSPRFVPTVRVLLFHTLATLAVGVVACEPDAEAPFRTDVLPGGALSVTNTGVPAWARGSGWSLEEDLRLGAVEGDGPEQFSRITAVRADSLGMIYVLDAFTQEIRVFDPSGAFSHRIGRMGEGPGEFMNVTAMSFDPSGNLWVTDVRMGRYSGFDSGGSLLASYPRHMSACPFAGEFTPDSHFVDCATAFPDEGPAVVGGARLVYYPVRFANDRQQLDSFPPIEYTREMITRADGLSVPQVFFGGSLKAYLDRSGQIWFADSREYRVFRRTLDGDTTLVFSLPAEPALIGGVETEMVRDTYRARPDLLALYLENLPQQKPIVHQILGDEAGHIFVVPEVAGIAAGMVIDVFRDNGEYLGRIDLPRRIAAAGLAQASLGPVYATRDHLYYAVVDEYDVPYLCRFRIHRST
jgi:hypothetical protein